MHRFHHLINYFKKCNICKLKDLHVVFEDVSSSRHIYDVIDDEFAESCKQISPLMESLNLVGLVLFISLCTHRKR